MLLTVISVSVITYSLINMIKTDKHMADDIYNVTLSATQFSSTMGLNNHNEIKLKTNLKLGPFSLICI